MKKKILIASFFATILLMVPCVSAFNMPLTNEETEELETIIRSEAEEIQRDLENILTSDGQLNVDEVVSAVEIYYQTGDDSVIQSDPFQWIIDRLGWVYITIDYAIGIYNAATNLYYEFIGGYEVLANWFESVGAMWNAFLTFLANPLNFDNIINLLTTTIDLLNATVTLIRSIGSGDLQTALENFVISVQNFSAFLQSNPWLEPISITGQVTGVDEAVTVSTKDDSETTTSTFDLTFTTTDSNMPWFVHKCAISAEYKDKQKVKNRYAFSMGTIEVDFDEADFRAKSKEIVVKSTLTVRDIIQRILLFASTIFKNLEYRLNTFQQITPKLC
jgi:hypothetical protein